MIQKNGAKANWAALIVVILAMSNFQTKAHGQHAPLFFAEVDIRSEEGPNSKNITAILKDSQGYLWIGTQNGLKRYDGHYTVSFGKHVNGDSTALLDVFITGLREDPSTKNIWIGTENGGLHILDPTTLSITPFSKYDARVSSNWGQQVEAISVAKDSSLWIGTIGDGGMIYQGLDSPIKWIDKRSLNQPADSILTLDAFAHAPTEDQQALIAVGSTLLRVDKSFSETQEIPEIEHALGSNEYISDLEWIEHRVWVTTSSERLLAWMPKSGVVREVEDFKKLNNAIESINLRYTSPSKRLWIASWGGGVYALNLEDESISNISLSGSNEGSISSNQVSSLLEDDDGVLWAGTFDGLNKAELGRLRFSTIQAASGKASRCNAQLVPAVMSTYEAPTEPGVVWLGMMGLGIQRYDKQTGEIKDYFACNTELTSPIFSMLEDRSGRFWMGNAESTLFELNRENMTRRPIKISENPGVQILQIYEHSSAPGRLWLTTNAYGLLVFDTDLNQVVKRYGIGSDVAASLSSNNLWRIIDDPWNADVIWIGTRESGLNRLDLHENRVEVFDSNTNPCLPSDRIASLAISRDSTLWVGSFESGLTHFDPVTGSCAIFGAAQGLPFADIGRIETDQFDRLWLLSAEGVTLFNPSDTTFTNFTVDDGLQAGMFLYPTMSKNLYGEMMLGGTEGFQIFQPGEILIPKYSDPVVFSEVTVLGQPQNVNGETLELNYQQNDLAFRFSTMDMRRSDNNQYRVRLLPASEEWQSAPGGASPRYPLLAPGAYTFEVMGTNSYGVWNKEPSRISFEIEPPVWQTWWFGPAIAAFFLGIVIAFLQVRLHHLRQDKRVRGRIAKDLHDKIGSGITSSALQMEWIASKLGSQLALKEQLNGLADGGRELVDDLRLIVWLVDTEYDSFSELVKKMEQWQNTMLKGIRCQFIKPKVLAGAELEMLQRKQIMLIYQEVLHNIVRHSNASSVEIEISVDAKRFTLRIEDDGAGFDPDDYKAGVGIRSMRERAEEIQATFSVKSRLGEGTLVELNAPLNIKPKWIQVITRLWKNRNQRTMDSKITQPI